MEGKDMKSNRIWLMAAMLLVVIGLSAVPASAQNEIVFSYQATNEHWWTGLVIQNSDDMASFDNIINIELKDEQGGIVGSGEFTFVTTGAQRVGLLKDFIQSGTVPARGSIIIRGSDPFSAVEIVGNDSGGFGMIEKES